MGTNTAPADAARLLIAEATRAANVMDKPTVPHARRKRPPIRLTPSYKPGQGIALLEDAT